MVSFSGDSGTEWSYDPAAQIGDRGGFGVVFRGVGPDGQAVAIKRVTLRRDADSERRRREREVEIGQVLATSSAKHVMCLIDVGRVEDDLLLVMPLADRSLAAAVEAGDLDQTARIEALRQVAQGLEELAEVPVLHRDLKPANVLGFGGVWQLADFGIARNPLESTDTYTFRGAGTYPYMAPELWNGQPASVKSELYALGVLAFELLAGVRPFEADNELELRRLHLESQPPPLPEAIPVGVRRVVLRMLAKDPASRPQDARAVVEKLDAAIRQLGPRQEALRQTAFAAEQRYLSEDAEFAARKAKREHIGQQISQALADLNDVLEETLDQASEALPEATLDRGGMSWELRWERTRLVVEVWTQSTPRGDEVEPGDPVLLVGAVSAAPNATDPYANIVCEVQGGRLIWSLLRFNASAIARQYKYGPRDRAHGFSWRDFVDQRRYMNNSGMHVWRKEATVLTAEVLVDLLREAISSQ